MKADTQIKKEFQSCRTYENPIYLLVRFETSPAVQGVRLNFA